MACNVNTVKEAIARLEKIKALAKLDSDKAGIDKIITKMNEGPVEGSRDVAYQEDTPPAEAETNKNSGIISNNIINQIKECY